MDSAAVTVATPGSQPRSRYFWQVGWLKDFDFSGGGMRVEKTGATARVDAGLLLTVFKWIRYYLVVRMVVAGKLLLGRRGEPTLFVWFTPDAARPWYMVRSAMAWGGMKVAQSAEQADIAFHFDDSTWSPQAVARGLAILNGACRDISKSAVARHFEAAFGYALLIDPERHVGEAVEKNEINSLHDGRIVTCPMPRRPAQCYQRFIDTCTGAHIQDLRTQCINGRPLLVMRKTRARADRFVSIANIKVERMMPEAVYSSAELAGIMRFLKAIGMDWGTLDILRDAQDGRIYIVDANKTDVGPVLNMTMRDKMRATAMMARALRAMIMQRKAV